MTPNYLKLYQSGELKNRIQKLYSILEVCELCPRKCLVNRLKDEKGYCGSGKKQNETWLKATINIDKIKDHIEEFKGHKFVRLNINIKDEADEYGKNVSLSVDKWQPEEQPVKQEQPKEESDDDLPF